MNLKEYFGVNFEHEDEDDLRMKVKALIVSQSLGGSEIDTLEKAYRVGLMESGDVPSKGGRASLLGKEILCQTCWKENNYTFSVTYPFGHAVVQALLVKK
jgi:hypothetical protein